MSYPTDVILTDTNGTYVTKPPQNDGLVDQDQLEQFLVKREQNQHTKPYNTIY
jgi:hypothetical protein